MRKLTLRRVDFNNSTEVLPSYSMELTVTTANDMPKEVFVKQRLDTVPPSDDFAAVASASQLEDLPVGGPTSPSSYFRTDSVKLVSSNPATLDEIHGEVNTELQLLIANLDALDKVVSPSRSWEISGNDIVSL